MKAKNLLLVIFVLLSGPVRLGAENREGAFTLGPFFGAQGFPLNGESHFDVDWYPGIRAGYNFTPNLGAEFVFGYNNTVRDPEGWHCKIYQYGADMLYHLRPGKRFVPFLAVGFGAFTVDYDDSALSSRTDAYFNFGGGLDYALTERMSVRADYRHAMTLVEGEHAVAGTMSLRFQFGRR